VQGETVPAAHVAIGELIGAAWGTGPLIQVTRGDVQAWLSELSDRGLAEASVRKAQGVLSGILGLAVRDRPRSSSRHSPTPPGPAGSVC
jgi:hypothetical protein